MFIESLHQRLGTYATVRDLVGLGVDYPSQYDPYEDKSQTAQTFLILDEEPEVTPEWENQYVNTETLFLRGDRMARGQEVNWKQTAKGILIGRSNQNLILDTWIYEVE